MKNLILFPAFLLFAVLRASGQDSTIPAGATTYSLDGKNKWWLPQE